MARQLVYVTKYEVESFIGHEDWEGRGWSRDLMTDRRWLEMFKNNVTMTRCITNKGAFGKLKKPHTKRVGGLKKMAKPSVKRYLVWW